MKYGIFSRLLLSVLLHTQFGAFPHRTPAFEALRLQVITGLQRECSKVFQQSVGPENWLNRAPVRKLLHFITDPALCVTILQCHLLSFPQNCEAKNRSLCQAQWQLSFMSGCRECHRIYHHHWQIWPIRRLLFMGRFMIFEILLEDGVMLLLLSVLQSTAAPRRWHGIKQNYIVTTGFSHVLVKTSIKILLCLSSRWTRILVK